jgi:succinate-acetate transporter protein
MKKANPMPLGLLGLGMSTVLLSFSLMNTYPTGEKVGSFVPVMAILLGGLTLVIACVLNYLKGDLFGATTFGGFALLCISFGLMNVGPTHGWWTLEAKDFTYYFILWAIFTFGLVVASTTSPRLLTIILTLLFILLGSLGLGATSSIPNLSNIYGYEGILTGVLAIYLAFAILINEMQGQIKLPVGAPFRS